MLISINELNAQAQSYIVKPAPFSSRINDEFSPVFYKGGIVFCSNLNGNSLTSYNDEQKGLFKIYYISRKANSVWSWPKILSKELTTAFNDGPVTFNENGDTIYYSRNNFVKNHLKNISDSTNKLGIFSAELIDGIWTNIKPFAHINPSYSYCTPSLAPDGTRIYFSSDIPGGSGGMDLYYCNRTDGVWGEPVSMGPVINTTGNESFPFACKSGKLFFASDRHDSFGGKDIFYTREIDGKWIVPVHLDSTINSSADDYGIVTDSTFENGYFSTNRRKTDDIFSFSSAPIEFSKCDSTRKNNYCFTFYDEHRLLIVDSLPVIYHWDFGNGIIRNGKEVKHCFPGPGKFLVKLTIIDELTGDTISNRVNYNVELANIDQAYINSDDVCNAGRSISFTGVTSDLKVSGITDYLWDFGDGFKPGGPSISRQFKKKGEFEVKLGLITAKDSTGAIQKICVSKRIKII